MEAVRPGRSVEAEVVALEGELQTRKRDQVVTEEPLELALSDGGATRTLAVAVAAEQALASGETVEVENH